MESDFLQNAILVRKEPTELNFFSASTYRQFQKRIKFEQF